MPGLVRATDLCSGHDCFSPVINVTFSPDTICNNINAVRFGDMRAPHSCSGSTHSPKNLGLHNVMINNRPAQAVTDPTDCGSIQVCGSPNVIIN